MMLQESKKEAPIPNTSSLRRLLCTLLQKKPKKPTSQPQSPQSILSPVSSSSSSSSLTEAISPERVEFKKVFLYFDENGDGKISPAELQNCMRTVGQELSVEDAEAVVESTDSDGDGLLGFEDFVKLVEVEGEEEERKNLTDAFQVYVTDGQDYITPESLRQALRQLGDSRSIDECKVMIRRFDLNGDGVLSFHEFRVMML